LNPLTPGQSQTLSAQVTNARSSIFISLTIFLAFPSGMSKAPWVSRQKLYSVPRMDIVFIKS
jgi:hypothetical protein